MGIEKDLNEMQAAGVIEADTVERIKTFYRNRGGRSQNILITVFSVLGAILVGMGLLLIIAHNWDNFPRGIKTTFAFLPLFIAQLLCGYSLRKKQGNTIWTESSSALLFFAIGGSISLISQIYNIPGNVGTFLQVWMLLVLPLIYLMQSSVTSLLYLCGITYYVMATGYNSTSNYERLYYWLFLMAALPFYLKLLKKNLDSNSTNLHHWLWPLSIIISLGSVAKNVEELIAPAYISLFGLFYAVAQSTCFSNRKTQNNPFHFYGSAGTVITLLILSFNWFWEDLFRKPPSLDKVLLADEFYATVLISLAAIILNLKNKKNGIKQTPELIPLVFLFFIPVFIAGMYVPVATACCNILLFSIGLLTIRKGAAVNNLGILNYGLLIITALITSRFFDTNMTFVTRGLLFLVVGAGFFAANYLMLKKRRKNG